VCVAIRAKKLKPSVWAARCLPNAERFRNWCRLLQIVQGHRFLMVALTLVLRLRPALIPKTLSLKQTAIVSDFSFLSFLPLPVLAVFSTAI
jgi:hypothetical protein